MMLWEVPLFGFFHGTTVLMRWIERMMQTHSAFDRGEAYVAVCVLVGSE